MLENARLRFSLGDALRVAMYGQTRMLLDEKKKEKKKKESVYKKFMPDLLIQIL